MNYALLKSASDLLDRPGLVRPYLRIPAQRVGRELLEMVDTTPDTGLAAADRALTERWAERLGLSDWFGWRPLDDLPSLFRRAWE